MATHYIEDGVRGNQYSFDPNNPSMISPQRSTQDRNYSSQVTTATTTSVRPSEYSPYPAGVSAVRAQYSTGRVEHDGNTYQLPQQHQSVAGFSKSTSQQSQLQQHQVNASAIPQVRASVRTVSDRDQQPSASQQHTYDSYEQSRTLQGSQVSPQHHQFQHDPHQQPAQQAVPVVYYQTPGAAQHTHRQEDVRTEIPNRNNLVQTQQVLVRSSSGSSRQQENSVHQSHPTPQLSTQQQQEQLQQYYSQLTPEQYHQLLRQQQLQRQQQEEQKRQQLAQQQYYAQQPSRSNQDSQQYDDYQQQRRLYQTSSNQEQQSQQQRQGQQEQFNAYYEQQRRAAAAQQVPPASAHQQEPYRTPVNIVGGQQYQQVSPGQQPGRDRTESERQRLDEQAYHAAQVMRQQQQELERAAQIEVAQSQKAAPIFEYQQPQLKQQQQPQQQAAPAQSSSQPVGLRGLMSKFSDSSVAPTPTSSTSSKHRSSSTHTSTSGNKTTTTTTTRTTNTSHVMTYSSLPQPREPPVNSVEYYQMQMQQQGGTLPSVQQAAAPLHIQGTAPGFGALRDRFKSGSFSESTNIQAEDMYRQMTSKIGGSSLSSLRGQYLNRAAASAQGEESFSQRVHQVSRSVVGQGFPQPAPKPQEKPPQAPPSQLQQSAPDEPLPQPQQSAVQEPTPVAVHVSLSAEEHSQTQTISEQQTSTDGAVAEGGSSSGASPLENDPAPEPSPN